MIKISKIREGHRLLIVQRGDVVSDPELARGFGIGRPVNATWVNITLTTICKLGRASFWLLTIKRCHDAPEPGDSQIAYMAMCSLP